ncbi:MAG: hypothetical protein ACREUT_03690 [Steroidobacteraceae bacterium]
MQWRRASQALPRAAVPEAGLVAAKWTAAKMGAVSSLWSAAPRWLGRYIGELSSAHTHSVPKN